MPSAVAVLARQRPAGGKVPDAREKTPSAMAEGCVSGSGTGVMLPLEKAATIVGGVGYWRDQEKEGLEVSHPMSRKPLDAQGKLRLCGTMLLGGSQLCS